MLQLILNNLFNKINCDVLRDDNGMVHQKMFYAIYEKNLVNHDWLRVLLPYLLYSVSEFLLTIFLISDLLSQAVVDAEKPAPNGIAADKTTATTAAKALRVPTPMPSPIKRTVTLE